MPTEQSLTTESLHSFLDGADARIVTVRDAEKPKAKQLASQVVDWYLQEMINQAPARAEMAIDAAFYDGDQWTAEEIAELEARNQHPSKVNLIKPTIDWLTGTEKRIRADWKVLPTTQDGSEDAKLKTKLLKYIEDVNHGAHKKSAAFAHAVKVGIGWREFGIRGDRTDEPIYIGHCSWRDIIYDSMALDPMFIEDGRFMFRRRVVDLDIALAMLPERQEELKLAAMNSYDRHWNSYESDVQLYYKKREMAYSVHDAIHQLQNRRLVVELVEGWYRKPTKVKKIKESDRYPWGTEYDPNDPDMVADVEDAQTDATLYDKVEMKMYVCMFIAPGMDGISTGTGRLLFNCRSPYKHNRFPFVPIRAFTKDDDGTPYGVVRNQRDPQRDFNKRHSKAQFILSTRGVIYDDGAVDDEDLLADEVARPDFLIKKKKGFDLDIHDDRQLAQEHIEISRLDEQYIRQSSGVTGENLGLQTNATSGIAIRNRQNEGGVITQDLFDNSLLHDQVSGEILLSLVEQFMDLPTIISVNGDAATEFLEINQPAPDGSGLINDITARKTKFKVSEQDYNATVRQSMFEELMKLVSSLPGEISLQLLDAVVDLSDIPERSELVRRIRQINGQTDPEDTTEEQIDEQRTAQQQQRDEAAKLARDEKLADIRKKNADAHHKEVSAGKVNVEALLEALEAAGIALLVPPQQTQMADAMVQEGQQGRNPAPAAPQQPQLPQPTTTEV